MVLIALAGCGKKAEDETQAMTRTGDPQRGKSVYLSNCAACHNSDPSKDGSVGPAIKGSNRELLIARILKASYPPDYKPKRQTRAMPAQPYLRSAIPDLVAFLNQP
jgi:mono/diheme cytochrome c family protein